MQQKGRKIWRIYWMFHRAKKYSSVCLDYLGCVVLQRTSSVAIESYKKEALPGRLDKRPMLVATMAWVSQAQLEIVSATGACHFR